SKRHHRIGLFRYWHSEIVRSKSRLARFLRRVYAFHHEGLCLVYFFDLRNFGSRLVVGVDDTQVVVDKLDRVSFAFQMEDRVGRKNLSW
ncbi:hypothetical protein Tco_1495804, partial [Tanacetum coccineum]